MNIVGAFADPASLFVDEQQRIDEARQQAAQEAGKEYGQTFLPNLIRTTLIYAAVGAGVGYFWKDEPWKGAGYGAAAGAAVSLTYQTGKGVGYAEADVKRQLAQPAVVYLGQRAARVAKTSEIQGLKQRIAAARAR